MKRTIAAITTSRSDYAHLHWLLRDLSAHPQVDLRVIALGPHLSPEFGHTGRRLERDGRAFTALECLVSSDSDVGMAKSLGLATLGLADLLHQMRPDLLLLIADRYEMLAPASVALTLRIPIAHVEGGEQTAGAIDDAVRNAITKMSHLHFACSRQAARQIIAMGEEAWRVAYCGSLSLDHLRRGRLLSASQLAKKLGFKIRPGAVLAVYHPVTLMRDTVAEAREVFAALEPIGRQILLLYPNADAGSRQIITLAERFVSRHPQAKLLVNLDHNTYLSLLRASSVLVGNSSSGIIESTSLGIPALNVGIRQLGREHAANVLDVPADRRLIRTALAQAFSPAFGNSARGLENPYGDGRASQIIVDVLTGTRLGPELLFKAR